MCMSIISLSIRRTFKGYTLPDLVATIGSLDLVLGEMDK